jgi:hypothetical protein
VPPPAPAPPAARGELQVEADLDPVHAAIDDIASERDADIAQAGAFTLFDTTAEPIDEPARQIRPPTSSQPPARFDRPDEESADLGEFASFKSEPFASDFEADPERDAEIRPPVGAARDRDEDPVDAHDTLAQHGMFGVSGSDVDDVPERSRPAVLPIAIATLVLGLLIGFAAAYYVLVGNRERRAQTPAATPSVASPQDPAAPPATASGAATPQKPGQYSEQKVASPAPSQSRAESGTARRPPAPKPTAAAAPAPAAAAPAKPSAVQVRGRLTVQSTPPRAGVMINGKWRGRTPLTLDDLPLGAYVVRIVQPGFQASRDAFSLTASDGSHTINARLEPVRRTPPEKLRRAPLPAVLATTGSMYIDSRPRGADVLVDGRKVGQTPLMLPDLRIGSHVVRIEMFYKRPWTTSARVTAGETTRVAASLEDK